MPKISELNPLTSLSYDDLVPVVNDPNGSPSNNKVTFKNFANSVVQFFDTEKIFDRIANTGNVTFTNTTISTRNTSDNLILTTKEQSGNVSIETAGNMKFDFIDGVMLISSSEYGDVMGIGQGMGPYIASNGSLYQYSFEVNEETYETWDQGSVSYPGTNQLWTEYGNSESTSARSSYFTLRSDVNNISAKISLANRGFISEKNWQFNANGALIFPNYGNITDSFSILEFKALEAYDTASMSGDTLTFDNASSTLLRNTLSALEVGDQIQLDGGVWSVTGIYTGGTNGSLTVNGDFSIPDIQFIQLPYKVNLIDGIRLTTNNGRTWSFGVDGELTLPGGQIIGGVDSTNGITLTTSRGTVLFGNQPENIVTQSSHFHIMPEDSSAIDLIFGDDTNYVKLPRGEDIVDISAGGNIWRFESDGSITLPPNSQIGSESPFNITNAKTITANNVVISDNLYDNLYRPLFNTNALDINADGGTSISVFAIRDESFTGGGSRTVYSQYEAALDGGFSYNNRHSSNFIDGGGSNQI